MAERWEFDGTTVSCEEREDGCLLVQVEGELDMASVPVVERCVGDLDRYAGRTLVIDLHSVTFMDSSGISLIMRLETRMREVGGSFALRRVARQPRRVLELAGLAQSLTFTS